MWRRWMQTRASDTADEISRCSERYEFSFILCQVRFSTSVKCRRFWDTSAIVRQTFPVSYGWPPLWAFCAAGEDLGEDEEEGGEKKNTQTTGGGSGGSPGQDEMEEYWKWERSLCPHALISWNIESMREWKSGLDVLSIFKLCFFFSWHCSFLSVISLSICDFQSPISAQNDSSACKLNGGGTDGWSERLLDWKTG